MKKFFTTLLTAIGLLSFSASAVNYLPAPTETSPVNGSFVGNAGDIKASWYNTRLTPLVPVSKENDLGNAVQRPVVDGYKYVSIELNGTPVDLENDFMFELYINDVSEENGIWSGVITMYPPFALYTWSSGDVVTAHIDAGIAKDATGNVNPAVDISFTHYDLNYSTITCTPKSGSSFNLGEAATITATWKNSKIESINKNLPTKPIFVTNTKDETDQIDITSVCSITADGSLQIEVPLLQAATYDLTIAEGALLFDDKTMNEEYIDYSFTIAGASATYPSATVSPVNNAELTSIEDAEKVVYNWSNVNISLNEKNDNAIEVYINDILQPGFEAYLTQDGVKTEASTGNGLVIDLSGINLQGGVYKVVLPTGYVLVSPISRDAPALWNNEVKTTYTVLVAPNPMVTPESGAQYKTSDNLSNVTVSWPSCYFNINNGKSPQLTIDGTPYNGTLDVSFTWSREEVEGYQGNVVNVNLAEIDLVPGEYVLTLPEGYATLAGPYGSKTVQSREVQVTFSVISNYLSEEAVQVDTEVSLDDAYAAIELTWPEEVSFVNADNISLSVKFEGKEVGPLTGDYVQLVPGGSSEPGIATLADNTDKGNTMFLLVGAAELISDLGTYTVEIPESFVENSLGQVNKAQTLTFQCTTLQVGAISPVEETVFIRRVEDVIFKVTYASDNDVKANSTEDAPVMVYATDVEYSEEFNWTDIDVLSISGNTLTINLGKELAAGTYYLSLREGSLLVNGMKNDGIYDYQFSVVDPQPEVLEEDPEVTPDPESKDLTEIKEITLSWEDYTIALNETNTVSATFAEKDIKGVAKNNTLVFSVSATEPGSYTLVVPANYIWATDADEFEFYNEVLTLKFTVVAPASSGDDEGDGDGPSSVNTIGVDFKDAVIYNLNGVRMDANKLTKGIYIINGRKVVVK